MMWFPPQELLKAVPKLRAFAESLEFRDFRFSAVVLDGSLALRCDWGDAHALAGVGPQAFEDERLLMMIAKQAIHDVIAQAMDNEARVSLWRGQ